MRKRKKDTIKPLVKVPKFKKKMKFKTKKYKYKKPKKLIKGPLFKRKKSMNVSSYKINKDNKKEIETRYNILTGIVVVAVIILMIGLFAVQVVSNDHYQTEMKTLTQKTVDGPSAPRGRIYDRKGRLVVDNKADKIIYYKKPSNITTKKETPRF